MLLKTSTSARGRKFRNNSLSNVASNCTSESWQGVESKDAVLEITWLKSRLHHLAGFTKWDWGSLTFAETVQTVVVFLLDSGYYSRRTKCTWQWPSLTVDIHCALVKTNWGLPRETNQSIRYSYANNRTQTAHCSRGDNLLHLDSSQYVPCISWPSSGVDVADDFGIATVASTLALLRLLWRNSFPSFTS